MAALDHVVINTLKSMDAAADLFAALGFTLTPRGHHSLGSINHLMMTPGAYLELVGVPDTGRQRQEVLDSPFGLNGLVLRTFDADATRDRLAASGFDCSPRPLRCCLRWHSVWSSAAVATESHRQFKLFGNELKLAHSFRRASAPM